MCYGVVSIQMGYGSRALNLLGEYYEGHIPSLSEGQLHVNPISSIDPGQVCTVNPTAAI